MSDDELEETEEEFLERHAQTARELQEEAHQEAENGQDEDGHEIELGMYLIWFDFHLNFSSQDQLVQLVYASIFTW